ncbi:MAG TPA: alpha-glucan family phosphorylase [Gammaproteobacteria bacterium]|nr:alpha-glucan family phosphorylase [Gammaproteobacteria bacterium]
MSATRIEFEIQPVLPAALARLPSLADDLSYTWDRRIQGLFANLDRELWNACGHNPKMFLRRVAQSTLEAAAANAVFLQEYEAVLSAYGSYLRKPRDARVQRELEANTDLVAYFCAEYGLHESLPLYAGGLGVLAGDHCKAANDLRLPFVAVGLFYRAGYLRQEIDVEGRQQLRYVPVQGADLAFTEADDGHGAPLRLHVELLERDVAIRAWIGQLGDLRLILLDTDLEGNSPEDRRITFELYGGDAEMRIAQEIVLGIGGVRALRALGLHPTVWHINEGHAAFLVLERLRERLREGLDFRTALEVVAAGTVFTTHTPVPAGHDVFPHDMMRRYFPQMIQDLGQGEHGLYALGASPQNVLGFNQTSLAIRGSRFHNGVSAVHESVASANECFIWPEIAPAENPLSHVTNGVHIHTYLATPWVNLFDLRFGRQWRNELVNVEFWNCIDELPDHSWWSIRQLLKLDLIGDLRERLTRQYTRHGVVPAEIERRLQRLSAEHDPLLVGFARRFATYKRATLLLNDPARLARLLADDERPVILIYAGKAHARDAGGQDLIRELHERSLEPAFRGRLFLVENYDISLARKLVTGVDIWLNNPEYPLEASGTSGMKAAINGAVHLSILDGWWAEGYTGDNGYGIAPIGHGLPDHERNRLEAEEICRVLFEVAKPMYFDRDGRGYSSAWVRLAKASQRTVLPRFNAERQVLEYTEHFYGPAARHARRLAADGAAAGRALAEWKQRVVAHWLQVAVRLIEGPPPALKAGEGFRLAVGVALDALDAADVCVECQIGVSDASGGFELRETRELAPLEGRQGGEQIFATEITTTLSGLASLRVRVYPHHALLAHRFEMGRMRWL